MPIRFSLGLLGAVWVAWCCCLGSETSGRLNESEIAAGWIQLFDGESLFGWSVERSEVWTVRNGSVLARTARPSLILTESAFRDFQISVDYRAERDASGSLLLRSSSQGAKPGPGGDCYQVKLADPARSSLTGILVGRSGRNRTDDDAAGALPTQESDGAGTRTLESGWNRMEVSLLGGALEVRINGQPVLSYSDPRPLPAGRIGLRIQQGGFEFRDIRLKPLGMSPLFNGRDLAGWRVFPGKTSRFSVSSAGELQIQDGPGQIETESEFSDFVLQLEVILNGKELNSGVFFRSIRGELWQGYESQIHNGFKDGNPALPADFGTGGIYRRVPARRILAEDQKWFSKTIVAAGPTLCVWVNGYPVTAWTDTREPDLNPRKGLRTAPGTIILQGHDPTTDLRFRNLRIAGLR